MTGSPLGEETMTGSPLGRRLPLRFETSALIKLFNDSHPGH